MSRVTMLEAQELVAEIALAASHHRPGALNEHARVAFRAPHSSAARHGAHSSGPEGYRPVLLAPSSRRRVPSFGERAVDHRAVRA